MRSHENQDCQIWQFASTVRRHGARATATEVRTGRAFGALFGERPVLAKVRGAVGGAPGFRRGLVMMVTLPVGVKVLRPARDVLRPAWTPPVPSQVGKKRRNPPGGEFRRKHDAASS
jgi:hypothetical protein